MRTTLTFALVVAGFSSIASAQPASRFEAGPVVRVDRVYIEGGLSGAVPVAGFTTAVRLWKGLGVEGEMTWANGDMARSYEGHFVSFAEGPHVTREEFERMAPTARRTLGYRPGTGGAGAIVVRGAVSPRVRMGARLGLSARSYTETSDFTILSIPPGIEPERVAGYFMSESRTKTRGGLLFGADAVIALTGRLSIVPEVRFVYGGPAQIGNKHREAGVGLRGVWRF